MGAFAACDCLCLQAPLHAGTHAMPSSTECMARCSSAALCNGRTTHRQQLPASLGACIVAHSSTKGLFTYLPTTPMSPGVTPVPPGCCSELARRLPKAEAPRQPAGGIVLENQSAQQAAAKKSACC